MCAWPLQPVLLFFVPCFDAEHQPAAQRLQIAADLRMFPFHPSTVRLNVHKSCGFSFFQSNMFVLFALAIRFLSAYASSDS
jgi:hypothetical protein